MPAKYLQTLGAFIKQCKTSKNFMQCAGGCRPISASEGALRVEFEVTEELTNPGKTLHGGCTATLIDIATTAACVLTPRAQPGVSVGLNVNYLAAAKLGDTIILDAKVTRIGKRLAYTEAELFRKSDNKMVAKGLHTKAFAE